MDLWGFLKVIVLEHTVSEAQSVKRKLFQQKKNFFTVWFKIHRYFRIPQILTVTGLPILYELSHFFNITEHANYILFSQSKFYSCNCMNCSTWTLSFFFLCFYRTPVDFCITLGSDPSILPCQSASYFHPLTLSMTHKAPRSWQERDFCLKNFPPSRSFSRG